MTDLKKQHFHFLAVFCLCGCLLQSGCRRGGLKIPPDRPVQTKHWGVTPARDGQSRVVVRPPLTLAWINKVGVTPGKTLAAVNEYVVFASLDGQITAIDIQTGKTQWTRKDRQKGEKTCAIEDSILIVGGRYASARLEGVHIITGKRLWQTDTGSVNGELLVHSGFVFLGTDEGRVSCYQSRTGERVWERSLPGGLRGSPALANSKLFVAGGEGFVEALSSEDGKRLWQFRLGTRLSAGPIFSAGALFLGDHLGRFLCLDAESGGLCWEKQVEGAIYLEAASDEDMVYIGTTRGIVYALDHKTGTIRWLFESGNVIGTSPVISGDLIYVGILNGEIVGLDRYSGEKIWSEMVEGRVRTTPILLKNGLIVGTERRRIYGFFEVPD